jgi:hypothetical protein
MYSSIGVVSSVILTVLPFIVSGTLNDLAQKRGKLYFGTETETWEWNDTDYLSHLNNVHEFGQLVPGNSMKVSIHAEKRANMAL